MCNSFFWYDYETTGIDPRRDRILQFAGLRTDYDFNIIDEPQNFFCKLSADILPQPDACLITGITPQLANIKGCSEYDFANKVLAQFSVPNTCRLGFNTLRFDDEFSRNLFYRNIFDPYACEWQQGNSRWDIIDLVRMTCALRPEGINWPQQDGKVSFKLENLTKANDIEHVGAHDALVDVYATIAVAKLLKTKQEKLFSYLFKRRNKKLVWDFLQENMHQAIVHTSRMFKSEYFCTSLVVPLMIHPKNNNSVICYDLRYDPSDLLNLTAEEILALWKGELTDYRVALKEIHVNKSPAVAPLAVLTSANLARIGLNLAVCEERSKRILVCKNLLAKLEQLYTANSYPAVVDVEHMLYDGFFSNDDRTLLKLFHDSHPDKFRELALKFTDKRLPELIFRLRARNFPETLTAEEAELWHSCCAKRLTDPNCANITLNDFNARIAVLRQQHSHNRRALTILEQLEEYAKLLL